MRVPKLTFSYRHFAPFVASIPLGTFMSLSRGESAEVFVGPNNDCGCRPRRSDARRFTFPIQSKAPPKIRGYSRTPATTGSHGCGPSCEGAHTATAARPRTVTPRILAATTKLLLRPRRSFAAPGSHTRWPCTSDGPAKAPGAYSGPSQFPHRSRRFRREDLNVRTIS